MTTWFARQHRAKPCRHLRPGRYYRVRQDFRDHDGLLHTRGQRWRFLAHDFLPYEDGLSLFFLTEHGDNLQVRLQDRVEAEGPVLAMLEDILPGCEPPHRSAFAGLKAVDAGELVSFDGIDRISFGWSKITSVVAAFGHQQYDATLCVTITHRCGTAIFLPETERTWHPFLDHLETQLNPVTPRQEWLKVLEDDPSRSVRVFRRRFSWG